MNLTTSLPKIPKDKLQEACNELLEWSRNGILLNDGVVREYAEELQEYIPEGLDALKIAVEEIKSMALYEIANDQNQRNSEIELLEKCETALDDWTHTYAPEFCNEDRAQEAYDRISANGGTLYYIADLLKEIRDYKEKRRKQ